MTPLEILQQSVCAINTRVSDVHYSKVESCYGRPDLKFKYGADLYKEYEHTLFRTRKYRDIGCAVYKLIKFVESAIDKPQVIRWRTEPKIIEDNDFNSQYKKYCGVVRFTTQVQQ